MHNKDNRTFIYFLVLTAIGASLTYHIVVKAYDNVLVDDYDVQLTKLK
ncbi:hypothetical protein K2P96_02905 [Patescibacteria group bacterium]|nr:hypothetical protein [Patescibacteria group bacterium]